MTDATKPNLRDNSELWADMAAAIRDIVGNWTDDEIAAVIRKVHSPTPDALLDDLGQVFAWCAAAQELGEDSEEAAAVGLWQHPALPIVITVRDGQVFHQIDPDVTVEITQ